jgi:hypothetical protein
MEPTELKIGDNVKFVGKDNPEFVGVEGVITCFRSYSPPAAYLSTGHLFLTENLELVAATPPAAAAEYIAAIQAAVPADPDEPEYTGGSVNYYRVSVSSPTTEDAAPYTAECNDIIEALQMNYAEGNAFKALWRMCAARLGLSKKGYTDGLYDSEKVAFFGNRLIQQHKNAQ